MNYSSSSRVKDCILELARIFNEEEGTVNSSDVDKAVRLLRPSKGSLEHISAIRARIRQSILNNSSSNDAQLELAKFEKQCDTLQKLNPKLLNPFLALLQPLSFPPERHTIASHISILGKKDETRAFTSSETTMSQSILKNSSTLRNSADGDTTTAAAHTAQLFEEHKSQIQSSEIIWVSKETERILLVDLIYIIQGISGKHIKYDAKTESYIIDPSLRLNSTVKDTVLCICELGWLYVRVSNYLKSLQATPTEAQGVVVQAFSFALQEELHDFYRLLAVLEQELQITGKVGTTPQPRESGLRQRGEGGGAVKPSDLVHHSHSSIHSVDAAVAEVASQGTSGLTLLRLRAWLQEPIERMCQMARMVDGAMPLRGGALVSRLYGHIQHGDPATRALVRRILDSVCAPLYAVLGRWVLYGELQDPLKEFFISMNASGNVRNIWRDTYSLQNNMIPAYFSQPMAHKILLIGKSINFIRLCLQKLPRVSASEADGGVHSSNTTAGGVRKSFRAVNKGKVLGMYGQVHTVGEEQDEMDVEGGENNNNSTEDQSIVKLSSADNPARNGEDSTNPNAILNAKRTLNMADVLGGIVTPTVQSALQTLRFGGEATLQDVVYSLSASIDAKLLNLVMSRFHIQTHLLALKKFMLLGQGDFVTCLMDGVGPELKRRANQLFRHNLTGILEGALRASNAQFEPSFVLDRIGIRLLEASAGDSGWEIFSLDYAIDAPLNAVVHMDCISKYRIAFHMLWRLKRVEWSLTTTWKQHTMFNHANRAHIPPALRSVFHRCYLNRAMMMHVVNNLCAFLMFEVLETSWLNLQETISRAKSLDDVITAHDAYLAEVLDRALLAPHHEGLNMQVQQLLHIILRFCSLEETLISDSMASIQRRKVADGAAGERAKKERYQGESPMAASAPSSAIAIDGVPEVIVARIDEAVKEYSRQFDTLMIMLKEQGERAGDILRFLTFRLDFNDFHLHRRAYGGSVGLTSTPPAHLKQPRSANIFSTAAATAGAAGSNAGTSASAGSGASQYMADGSDRLSFHGPGVLPSPQRSSSPPTYGFSGPEAWSVPDMPITGKLGGSSGGGSLGKSRTSTGGSASGVSNKGLR